MSEAKNDAKSIMDKLEQLAQERGHLDAFVWLEGAVKLSALLQTEEEGLVEVEHALIKMKAELIEGGRPANQAKLMVEADDRYLWVMKQRAFIKRCDSIIQLAKKHATISSDQAKY
tara:strand:+ start:7939 stop:8286 length:348 start_codon:yes stop_codon:yes gene_type:complete